MSGITYIDLSVPGQCETVFCTAGVHGPLEPHVDATGSTWYTHEAPHLTPGAGRRLCLLCDADLTDTMAVEVFLVRREPVRAENLDTSELRLCVDCGRDGSAFTPSMAARLVEAQRRRLGRG